MTSKPPRFKPFQPPKAPAVAKLLEQGRFRGSPSERGYGRKWDRLSIAFRKRNPWCEWCRQEGQDRLADLVDHKIPVQDRQDLVLEWKNLWSLCTTHHGKKLSWEIYARKNGLLDALPTWCSDPSARPSQFRCDRP